MSDRSFRNKYGPWAVITGGSQGVGAAWAREIAQRGVNLFLVARRLEVLGTLADEIASTHGVEVEVLSGDVTDPEFVAGLQRATAHLEVGLVVHNVGSVDREHGWFIDDPLEVTQRTITINCVLPTQLGHAFLPPMRERGHGGFVLVGSLTGMAGQALEATYSAAKGFTQIFAEALWSELRPHDIDVVCVPLGGTRTEALETKGLLVDVDLPTAAEVVAEAIEHLDEGPVYVPVEANRRFFDRVTRLSRRDAAQTMAKVAFQWIGDADHQGSPTAS